MEKIGLIAGNKKFPILFAQAAKKQGKYVVAVAIKRETSPQLVKIVDKICWLSLSEFKKMFEFFKSQGVKKVVMAGQISPWCLFSREVRESQELQNILTRIKDRRANTIFSEIAKMIEAQGLELLDSTTYLDEFKPMVGILTKRQPTQEEIDNINFGIDLAKKVAQLDIGLSVGVKNKAIVAVEALEGTDNLIRRAGKIARGDLVIAKVGRPNQDMRFDIPIIGLNTIKTLISAKATCLAIEAKTTLIIDIKECIKLADKKGICIVTV